MSSTSAPRPVRRAWPRIALLLAAAALTLKVGDLVVGLIDPAGISHFDHKRAFDGTCLALRTVENGFQIWDLVPGSRAQCDVLYRINSLGFRGAERSREKPPGTHRVVVLGDSVTFGWGVEDADRFTDVAERILDEGRAGGPRIELFNLAVPGYETSHQWIAFRERALALDPDAVVFVFNENDVQTAPDEAIDLERMLNAKADRVRWLRTLLVNEFSRSVVERALPNLRHLGLYFYLYRAQPEDEVMLRNKFASMREGIEISALLLQRAHSFGASQNVSVGVCDLHRFQPIAERCQAAGIPYADISIPNDLADLSLRNSACDPHPNAKGHRLYAANLARALRELKLVPGE